LLAHYDLEPLFAVPHDAKLPLVSCTVEVGQIRDNRVSPLCFAAEAVDSAGALLDVAGVPREIGTVCLGAVGRYLIQSRVLF